MFLNLINLIFVMDTKMINFFVCIYNCRRWVIIIVVEGFGHVINDLSLETKDQTIKSYPCSQPENETARYQPYIIIGGIGNDTIEGSKGDDILIGNKGEDIYQGFEGKDVFVAGDGDTILDFNINEGDILHLSDLIQNNGGTLDNYIQFKPEDTHTLMLINSDGQGKGYSDAVIRIENRGLISSDIAKLWANGNLETNGLSLPVEIESLLISDKAEESSQQMAEIEIGLQCDYIPDGLSIPYEISGDAEYGTDFYVKAQVFDDEKGIYSFEKVIHVIPVKLRSGDSRFVVQIIPVIDNVSEFDEKISFSLKEISSMYKLASNDPFEITIQDGLDRIKIESSKDTIQESNNTLEIVISRIGALDVDQRVDLMIIGNAENGTDYTYIPSSVVLREGESRQGMKIQAFVDEDTERIEVMEVLIKESDSYIIDKTGSSVVVSIVDAGDTYVDLYAVKRSVGQLSMLITYLKILAGDSVDNMPAEPVFMRDVLVLLRGMD